MTAYACRSTGEVIVNVETATDPYSPFPVTYKTWVNKEGQRLVCPEDVFEEMFLKLNVVVHSFY